ncbi:protein kinase [Phytomonospora sp. NPDC050363]|uniref:protein kinase domain-containing protein n=1 Tax=Phytomonospora sp. NPDC050363 TaxID=3155642 RepID=UPI0033D0329E
MTAIPTEPTVIGGRYELTHLIKSGGMGQVWSAYDTTLDRPVAVKLIKPELIETITDREALTVRFRREARVTARLDHPGVPTVYDALIDADAEQLYMVMQLVSGTDLRDLLKLRGRLPVEWVAAIAAQVCSVLAHAHALPVVHRDLKPGNIMIAEDGTVKVCDFGIAAILLTDATRVTADQAPGTYNYMSPEQFLASGVSPRSDLYSLGCVMHELLTGDKVFDGTNQFVLMRQHSDEPPIPVGDLAPAVPEGLGALVARLLAKSPQDRPESAREVHERLTPFLPRASDSRPGPTGDGDPTSPFRHPFALRKTPLPPEGALPALPPAKRPVAFEGFVADLAQAQEHAWQLVEDERFSQALGVLAEALEPAEQVMSHDEPELLDARRMYAVTMLFGGDARGALPKFTMLAADLAEAYGPDDEAVYVMRLSAAQCHVRLGDVPEAVAAYREVLRDLPDHRAPLALEARRHLGVILASSGDPTASAEARSLHADLVAAHGPDDPRAAEVADLISRLDDNDPS